MEVDREIALVFLEEAYAHLAVLANEHAGPAARQEAARELEGSAGLVGLSDLAAAAADASRILATGDPVATAGAIDGIAARLQRLADELGAPPLRTTGDGASPLEGDGGFDPDDARMLRGFFVEEAQEHLEAITEALLAFQKDRNRRTLVDEILRKTHTLKGSAATVGLRAASEAAHRLEDAFAELRAGKLAPDDFTIDGLIAAVDTVRAVVAAAERPDELSALAAHLAAQLGSLRRSEEEGAAASASPGPIGSSAANAPHRPPGSAAATAANTRTSPAGDTAASRAPAPPGGPATAASRSEAAARRADARATDEGEVVFDDRRLVPDRRKEDLHLLRVDARKLDELMDSVGELVFDRTRIERRVQDLRGVVRGLSRVRIALRGVLATARTAPEAAPPSAILADRIAEIEAELAGHVARLLRGGAALLEDTEALHRTTATLQAGMMAIRMQPLRTLFVRLARPLRDLARSSGKRIELVTSGEETEIDKAVVDQVVDPLVQILRNAVAHGIEPPTERVARGKPPIGRITLSARHQGDSVFLEIADDGEGIDTDALRRHLVETGRMSTAEAAAASDERVVATIFEPGVSVRDDADELAGRGVGLDVVSEAIARLGGEISVASARGQGTRFQIRLPLTTAMAQALLFKVAGQVYAVPNVHVVETTSIEASTPAMPSHLRVRDETVPLVSLHRLLAVELPADARRLPAVILEFAGRRLGITCDRVIGPREIVIKGLGPLLAALPLFAGATISGAGKVQLILDPAALVKEAYPQAAADEAAAVGLVVTASASATASLTRPGDSGGFPAPRPGGPGSADFPPARILLADDAKPVRESLARMLSAEGHIVDVAADGEEAWRMLSEVSYDLLVTDLEMPNLDGYALIERVRAAAEYQALPIVVVSSRTGAHRDKAIRAGASAFLSKPVTRKAIAERVVELLARK